MAIEVLPRLSPRIIKVPKTDSSISMQNLVNEVRDWEDNPWNMTYPKLLSATGKQVLGPGVSVGITVQLEDALLSFESVTTSKSVGSATSNDTSGTNLIDINATFQTDGVTTGALITNFTDKSIASVISIKSETEILHEKLDDGTNNSWTINDSYKIWNVYQRDATGGNLTALDSNGNSVSPIQPTSFTQIIKTSSSSATLQELTSIQYSSFSGGVLVDVLNGMPGTAFPSGTIESPVNNLTDALSIANSRGFRKLYINGDITFDSSVDIDGFEIVGESFDKSIFTIDNDASVSGTEFKYANVVGTLDGNNVLEWCKISDLDYINGVVTNSLLDEGTIVLGGNNPTRFLACWGISSGSNLPTIDMNGSGRTLDIQGFYGGIKIINKTGSENVTIDLASGEIVLDSTITNGSFKIRGIGNLTDNSTGTTVESSSLLSKVSITGDTWNEPASSYTTPGTVGYIMNKVLTVVKFLGLK